MPAARLLRCNIKDIGHNDALIGLKEDPGEIVGPQAVRGMIASTVNPFSKSAGRDEKARPGEAGMEERGEGLLGMRSEEHTSELQSLMRISYAVFCLKKKKQKHNEKTHRQI